MKLSRILYLFSNSLASMRQNLFIHLITVGVAAISFLIFSTFILIFSNLNSILTIWEKDVQIEAYLKDGISPDNIAEARRSILMMDEVEEVIYINNEEALRRFREDLDAMANIVDDLGDNPLPQSFDIELKVNSKGFDIVGRVAENVKKIDGVTDVVYGQEWVQRFSTALAIGRLIGMIVASFLLLATVFIVSNTIRLTVYARKEELEIMRLMGATDSFIKFPFLIEGALQGLAGAGTAIVSLYLVYKYFIVRTALSMQASLMAGGLHLDFLSWITIGYLLLGGMVLGLFGSFVSLGRFLKV